MPEKYSATLNLLLIDYIFENKNVTALSFDNVTFIDGVPSNNFNNANNSDNEYPGIFIRSSRLSTFLSVRVQFYIEKIDIKAGFRVDTIKKGVNSFSDPINPYFNKSDRREIHLFF